MDAAKEDEESVGLTEEDVQGADDPLWRPLKEAVKRKRRSRKKKTNQMKVGCCALFLRCLPGRLLKAS